MALARARRSTPVGMLSLTLTPRALAPRSSPLPPRAVASTLVAVPADCPRRPLRGSRAVLAAMPDDVAPASSPPSAPVRLVAVDMDGTLLRPDSNLSDATVATLRRVRATGAVVCVASGRPAPTIRRYARQLDIGPIPAVCFNGACAMLLDGDGGEGDVVWRAEHLSRSVVSRVLDVAEHLDLPVQYCLPDRSVTAPINDGQTALMDGFDALVGPEGHSARVRTLRPAESSDAADESSWPFPPPLKLIVVAGSQTRADEVAGQAREMLSPDLCHIIAAEQHVEFLMPGTNKATGLRSACEALGVSMAETAAFGDADNDAEMLAACGVSYAMPHGREKALAAAKRRCRFDNANDGVAVELEALLDADAIAPAPVPAATTNR